MEPLPKLYSVHSIAPEFDGFKDLKINWYVERVGLQENLSWRDCLAGEALEPNNIDSAKIRLSGFFTKAETCGVVEYLLSFGGGIGVEEVPLPISEYWYPAHMLTLCRRGVGQCSLYKLDNYPLPFKVSGVFDRRLSERIPPPDTTLSIDELF